MKESEIQKKIINYLTGLGAYVVKVVVGNKNGIPDVLVCIKGKFVGVEVKVPGEEPTELQKYNIRKIIEAGGIAFYSDSVNDVIYKLKLNKIK